MAANEFEIGSDIKNTNRIFFIKDILVFYMILNLIDI
tara:strand:+ start:324 stop:434 length:111 start_codon:yes stop_codon:yes gene_type:complete